MIIFYDKQTGKIEGTIEGRVTTEDQLKMWIGDQNETDRIVINWKPVKFYDKNGQETTTKDLIFTADFEPDHPQKDLFIEIDKDKSKILNYKIDLETMRLVPKE